MIPVDGASLCTPPANGDGSLERNLETLLGASAMVTRFGGLLAALLLPSILEAVGYGGAGLMSSVLMPRKACALAAA